MVRVELLWLLSNIPSWNGTSEFLLFAGIHHFSLFSSSSFSFFSFFFNELFMLIFSFLFIITHSINVSGHKFGLVYPGVGWIIWRSREFLSEELVFNIDYLGGIFLPYPSPLPLHLASLLPSMEELI